MLQSGVHAHRRQAGDHLLPEKIGTRGEDDYRRWQTRWAKFRWKRSSRTTRISVGLKIRRSDSESGRTGDHAHHSDREGQRGNSRETGSILPPISKHCSTSPPQRSKHCGSYMHRIGVVFVRRFEWRDRIDPAAPAAERPAAEHPAPSARKHPSLFDRRMSVDPHLGQAGRSRVCSLRLIPAYEPASRITRDWKFF